MSPATRVRQREVRVPWGHVVGGAVAWAEVAAGEGQCRIQARSWWDPADQRNIHCVSLQEEFSMFTFYSLKVEGTLENTNRLNVEIVVEISLNFNSLSKLKLSGFNCDLSSYNVIIFFCGRN